jgi:ubiquitin C-terminal hydrolase
MLKRWVERKDQIYEGDSQHDSQEFLGMLMTTIHEDINQISLKPYSEQKDSDGRLDTEVANEFWLNFKARENSIFINLFYG